MVGPHAATLGNFALALSDDRFLLEETASNSILSLHPAVHFPDEKAPTPFTAIEDFTPAGDGIEVRWQPLGDLQPTTILKAPSENAPHRLELQVRFANLGDAPVQIEALHPLYFPPEGPGACALGMENLRTLAAPGPGKPLRLARLHGDRLQNPVFGAWFSPTGSPMLLLAPLQSGDPAPRFRFSGIRGKMLSLRVDAPLETSLIEPGQTFDSPSLLLAMGNCDILEELAYWTENHPDPIAAESVPSFFPSDHIPEPDPPPPPDIPKEITPAELPEETAPATQDPKTQGPAPEGPESPEPLSDSFPLPPRPSRCAFFRGAMRATRGFRETGRPATPRWAAGRRYEPIDGGSCRTRGYWRLERPKEEF